MLTNDYDSSLSMLEIYYEPVINTFTGDIFGYEAKWLGYENSGFDSLNLSSGPPYYGPNPCMTQLLMIESAVHNFTGFPDSDGKKLFLKPHQYMSQNDISLKELASSISGHADIPAESLCIIVESGRIYSSTFTVMPHPGLVVDGFGESSMNPEIFYLAEPRFVRMSKKFLSDVDGTIRKKVFIGSMISMFHTLGIRIIATGISTEEEFLQCRNLGIDFIQGEITGSVGGDGIRPADAAERIKAMISKDRRLKKNYMHFISTELDNVKPVMDDSDIENIFEKFRSNEDRFYFPVVNDFGEPEGIIRENDLRKYIFSPYGKQVLEHKLRDRGITDLISGCPSAEITYSLEKIISIFTQHENPEGIIITENFRYRGFLKLQSLLKLLSDKQLIEARDQNPLTKLPGNISIMNYLKESLTDTRYTKFFVYFDFNHFKPFNDEFGFRRGDKAILCFSTILVKNFSSAEFFTGHIGGDDFFLGIRTDNASFGVEEKIIRCIDEFAVTVIKLYPDETAERGYFISEDRSGNRAEFGLLTVSAAAIRINPGESGCTVEKLSEKIFELKKKVKKEGLRLLMTPCPGC